MGDFLDHTENTSTAMVAKLGMAASTNAMASLPMVAQGLVDLWELHKELHTLVAGSFSWLYKGLVEACLVTEQQWGAPPPPAREFGVPPDWLEVMRQLVPSQAGGEAGEEVPSQAGEEEEGSMEEEEEYEEEEEEEEDEEDEEV